MGATVVTASNNNNNREAATPGSKLRGRSETKMRAPSFTSALINRSAPSASATVGSVTISKSPVSFSKPIQKAEKQEARLTPPKPLNNKSNQSARNSPPKSDERVLNQQRWNDGSIERLAEKWAAKRDALLKETGVIGENLQQRKAEMEQKLESVKRSIPKRSLALTPKRLSLCETSVTVNKSESPKEELTKRKSLDADIVLTTESEEDSDEDGDKVDSLPPPPPPPQGSYLRKQDQVILMTLFLRSPPWTSRAQTLTSHFPRPPPRFRVSLSKRSKTSSKVPAAPSSPAPESSCSLHLRPAPRWPPSRPW